MESKKIRQLIYVFRHLSFYVINGFQPVLQIAHLGRLSMSPQQFLSPIS